MPGIIENGTPAGNWDDKYINPSPGSKLLNKVFFSTVKRLVRTPLKNCRSICELGCGEGHLAAYIHSLAPDLPFNACDFSQQVIEIARNCHPGLPINFYVRDIYDIGDREAADLVICCEVLEHLEDPEAALEFISALGPKYVLFSVPREPIWRIMNLAVLKNIPEMGNTPGHIRHWTSRQFYSLLGKYFHVVTTAKPARVWSMALCSTKKNTSTRKEDFPCPMP